MNKSRMEAFSDGVLAIIITIMVLELRQPVSTSFASLLLMVPVFLSYLLSFIYVGIYWSNHHHLLQSVKSVNGKILWANLHLLFWLSLVPFVTAWVGTNHFSRIPMALYGGILLMAAIAYNILQRLFERNEPDDSVLHNAIGSDLKGKLSIVLYIIGIGLSFYNTYFAAAIYIIVALMWLVPDKRIEQRLK